MSSYTSGSEIDTTDNSIVGSSAAQPLGIACDKANIADLNVRNPYESQILSTLTHFAGGLRIVRYPFVAARVESFTDDFYKNIFLTSFDSAPNKFKKKLDNTMKKHESGDNFECDLYIQLLRGDEDVSVSQFLQLSTQIVYSLNDFDPNKVNIAGKWVLLEISESAQHLPHKLYQIERALHFLPRAASDFSKEEVGAVIVLLNGKQEDADLAISYVKLNSDLLISNVPVFVGWVPFRNLFVTISDMQGQVEKMGAQLTELTTEVGQMDSRLTELTADVGKMGAQLTGLGNSITQSVDRLLWVGGAVSFCLLAIFTYNKVGNK